LSKSSGSSKCTQQQPRSRIERGRYKRRVSRRLPATVYRGILQQLLQLDLGGWCSLQVSQLWLRFQTAATSREGGSFLLVPNGGLPCGGSTNVPRQRLASQSSFDEPPWKSSAFLGLKHEQRRRVHAPGALNLAAISFKFAARSSAQKCRALQPNGEKRSHGVDSCSPSFASPTTISTKSPSPISLTQQDHLGRHVAACR
jgi:hypothetical protein